MILPLTHEDAIAEALADLTPRQEQAFQHVLGCDSCRGRVRAAWKPEIEIEDLDDTLEENPAFRQMLRRVSETVSRSPLFEAREQVEEVLQAAAQGRGEVAALSHLHPRELATVVLMRIRESSPAEALRLCDFFDQIIQWQPPADPRQQALLQLRGTAARANAERALGRWSEAGTLFRQGLELLGSFPWQTLAAAELLRGYGVLAWEKGELDLAEALLRQSARVQGEIGEPDEEAEAWVLLGLVAAERGAFAKAIRLLRLGRKDLSRRNPWLDLQARYEHARLAACLGNPQARQILKEDADSGETSMATEARAQWLEGRVHAALGDLETAEQVLEGARVSLLAEKAFAHAALCTADLALLLLDQGKVGEVERHLLSDLLSRFEDEPAMRRIQAWALGGLRKIKRRLVSEDEKLEVEVSLRRLLRMAGQSVLVEIP